MFLKFFYQYKVIKCMLIFPLLFSSLSLYNAVFFVKCGLTKEDMRLLRGPVVTSEDRNLLLQPRRFSFPQERLGSEVLFRASGEMLRLGLQL